VSLAGVLGGLSLYIFRRVASDAKTGVNGAICHSGQRLDATPPVIKSLISIVMVGMGAAIGREAGLKDTGAALAEKVSGVCLDIAHTRAKTTSHRVRCGCWNGCCI
jgi:CIC family chloride channel protein